VKIGLQFLLRFFLLICRRLSLKNVIVVHNMIQSRDWSYWALFSSNKHHENTNYTPA